jgi:hypothetical protein
MLPEEHARDSGDAIAVDWLPFTQPAFLCAHLTCREHGQGNRAITSRGGRGPE